ncbi:hypothetical protein BDY21DRAFT_368292 [Lineolata rhizophorae]|uniref:Uncharacterized protein n=1 Tax=Lineolata rhizophorae TaxID=578093 RepID=A0A6A6PED1_9PEZI|nr:hypothetical protein BDY21DRAFT_368292 [Lineolata rhizophorae]
MASSYGTKVTSDPEARQNPVQEKPGVVDSDSLAAESMKGSGEFASNIEGAGNYKQPAGSNTTNAPDASAARVLDPAPDAETREAQTEWNESAQLNAGRGLGKEAGRGPTYNTTGGSYSNGGSVGGGVGGGGQPTMSGGGVGSGVGSGVDFDRVAADPAPTYVGHERLVQQGQKPKGTNLHEGGFEGNEPNASFTTAIGTDQDPGRFAEQKFERENAESGPDAGYTRDTTKATEKTAYAALDETSA